MGIETKSPEKPYKDSRNGLFLSNVEALIHPRHVNLNPHLHLRFFRQVKEQLKQWFGIFLLSQSKSKQIKRVKVLKNRPSKICGRQPLKNLLTHNSNNWCF